MLDRQNMNATVYSRKRPIEIVIVSAVMVVLALVRIWAHFSDPSSFGRLFDVYSVILSALLLFAAVGLWRVRRWGETVYRLLAIYMIGSGVVMIFASSAISVRIVNVRRRLYHNYGCLFFPRRHLHSSRLKTCWAAARSGLTKAMEPTPFAARAARVPSPRKVRAARRVSSLDR